MPLTQPLSDLRKHIKDILMKDLPPALQVLQELLPEGTEKHSLVLAMRAQLNEATKERYRNTISAEEYARKVDSVRANFFDLLDGLTEADFEAPAEENKPGARTGSVLYRVPHRMPLQKPVICTIRVAIDEDALLEDIVLDDDVRVKQRVEVSDMMKAELLDVADKVFEIRNLSEAEQLVRESGKTQWLFSVTPLAEGQHQLLVKVSMMEYVPNLGRYVPREVSILETITIVTELIETEDVLLKPAGKSFAIGAKESSKNAAEVVAPAPSAQPGAPREIDMLEHVDRFEPNTPAPPPPLVAPVPKPARIPSPDEEDYPAPSYSRKSASPLFFIFIVIVIIALGYWLLKG